MRITFWGTRGSLPKPGPTTLRYGGNTSCVEVWTAEGTLIVLDCGTGAHGLGRALLTSAESPLRGHLFITHTHWDHIQGFPFFAPLFVQGHEWDIYGPGGLGHRLEAAFAGQMKHTYFPVALSQLDATIRFHDLGEGRFTIGGARVVTQHLNHPAPTLGYRLEADGVALVYSVDHEPLTRSDPAAARLTPRRPGAPIHQGDRRHTDFLAGADLVIHDAQYTAEEYPTKVGWGHTPVEWAVDYALASGAKRLALFHHDPDREDEAVDGLLMLCRRRAAALGGDLYVFAAAEGRMLELGRQPASVPRLVTTAQV